MAAGLTTGAADRQAATTAAARQVLADHYSDDKNSELFGVTELCNAFDVTPRTLRFYEQKELLFPIREGQKRLFTRRDQTVGQGHVQCPQVSLPGIGGHQRVIVFRPHVALAPR